MHARVCVCGGDSTRADFDGKWEPKAPGATIAARVAGHAGPARTHHHSRSPKNSSGARTSLGRPRSVAGRRAAHARTSKCVRAHTHKHAGCACRLLVLSIFRRLSGLLPLGGRAALLGEGEREGGRERGREGGSGKGGSDRERQRQRASGGREGGSGESPGRRIFDQLIDRFDQF